MEHIFSEKIANLKPSAIREIFKSLTDPTIISFAAGNPAPESFPKDKIAKISADIFSDASKSTKALQYSITEGMPEFIAQIENRLAKKFGIGRDFDKTIITTGGQQGIDLACKVLCNEGDTVICEDPSFIGALNSFRANGAKLVGVEMEDDGINVEKLELALKENKAKLLYLIPTFHNPMGVSMSLEKRKKVYALAKKYGVIILEDNPYGELRFSGEDIPTIKSMDEDGIVIYCSSFSKILSAGMRIGYVCAPADIIQKIVVAKQVNDVHSNIFFQMICSAFISEYDLDGHIDTICDLYRHKSGVMLNRMDEKLAGKIKYTRPEGGLFVWCELDRSTDPAAFVKKALEHKLAVVPGSAFMPDETKQSYGFRITYATPCLDDIVRGIDIIADIL